MSRSPRTEPGLSSCGGSHLVEMGAAGSMAAPPSLSAARLAEVPSRSRLATAGGVSAPLLARAFTTLLQGLSEDMRSRLPVRR
eukprot:1019941-Pyramimonas_sp.AAC.1